MNRASIFAQTCVFLFIALSPIQDCFLRGTFLRTFGASPSVFPLLALAALVFAQWLVSGQMKVDRVLLICLVYMLAITAYGFLFFGFRSHGVNLIWTSTTAFITLAVTIFAANNIDYRITSAVRAGIYSAFLLMVLGFCFNDPNPFGLPPLLENPILHATPIPTVDRPRGLSSEPSELSISVIGIGLLCAHVARGKIARSVFIAATLVLLIATGSKGGILTLFFCILILCIIRWHSRWYHVPGLVLILLPAGYFLIDLVSFLFPQDLVAGSGTVTTRGSMILCSLMTVWHHPLGVGFSGFLPSVTAYLPNAMFTVQSWFPFPLSFSEVSLYLTSPDMVSTKTFFFDQLMRFGVPFALCFGVFSLRILKALIAKKQLVIAIVLLASIIAIATYVTGLGGNYTFAIVFGVALSEVRSGANTRSSE